MKTESKTDAERLEVEKQIMTGLQAEEHGRLQAARGLRRLDDADLWPKCTSKAKYLWEKFNISEERAKQLLDFLMIREAIRGDRVPDNERQTRALKRPTRPIGRRSGIALARVAAGRRPPARSSKGSLGRVWLRRRLSAKDQEHWRERKRGTSHRLVTRARNGWNLRSISWTSN